MQQTASVMCARAASCSRAVLYILQCWVEAHAILHDTCYMNADSLSPCAIQSSGFMLSEGAEPALYLHIHLQLDMQLDTAMHCSVTVGDMYCNCHQYASLSNSDVQGTTHQSLDCLSMP